MTKKGITHGTFRPKMRFSSSLEKAAKIEYVAASKMAYPMMKIHIPMKPVSGIDGVGYESVHAPRRRHPLGELGETQGHQEDRREREDHRQRHRRAGELGDEGGC
jgi:hypothetical protein